MSEERDEKNSRGGAAENDNLLPLDEGVIVLPPESEEAIRTLGAQIAEYERRGEEGLRPLSLLLERLGESVFAPAEGAAARLKVGGREDSIPSEVLLFGGRNVELLIRAMEDKGEEVLASGVRFILRDAPEPLVIAHALAAIGVLRQASAPHLRARGLSAFQACLRVAQDRGFGARVEMAFAASEEEGGTEGGAGDGVGGNSKTG